MMRCSTLSMVVAEGGRAKFVPKYYAKSKNHGMTFESARRFWQDYLASLVGHFELSSLATQDAAQLLEAWQVSDVCDGDQRGCYGR